MLRYLFGHSDLAVGPGTVWDIPADADVSLLEWRGAMPAVGEHIERVFRALYEISETPRTAFGDSGRMLSGVALETELRPIIQKTLRRRVFWTRALRRRNAMILRLAERYGRVTEMTSDGSDEGCSRHSSLPSLPSLSFALYRSDVIWSPMVPSDDTQDVRNQVALVEAGLRSRRTAMDQLGTESPEEELERVLQDRKRVTGVTSDGGGDGPLPSLETSVTPVTGAVRRPRGRPREGRAGE